MRIAAQLCFGPMDGKLYAYEYTPVLKFPVMQEGYVGEAVYEAHAPDVSEARNPNTLSNVVRYWHRHTFFPKMHAGTIYA